METSDKNSTKNNEQFRIPDDKEMRNTWENYEEYKKEFPKPDMKKVWAKVNQEVDKPPVQKIIRNKKWLRYAAAILIPIAFAVGYYLYDLPADNQINFITQQAEKGTRKMVTLPDGSEVWLQPGASITYPDLFNTNKREVEFSGKGYFKVTKNADKPFTVKASDISVQVLGTQFYIKNVPGSSTIETGLVSGKVKVVAPIQEINLSPDDILVYSVKENKLTKSNILGNQPFKWDNGKIVFDNCELTTVLNELAEWYNVDLKVESEELQTQKITLTIKEESLTEIMDILKLVSPINYQYHENELSVN